MKWLRKVRFKLGALFGRGKFDAEMDAEMRMHLELRIERNISAGMSAEEARYAALRDFGGLDQIKERARDQRGGLWLGHLIQDFRYGLRLLRKSPGFTGTAVLTLAIGIGACAAVFSVVNAVVLHPFSYPNIDRLMVVRSVFLPTGSRQSMATGDFFDYRHESAAFAELATSNSKGTNFIIGNEPMRLYTEYVTVNFFKTLGVRPFLGRDFRPEEEIRGNGNVIILGYNAWREQFSGHSDVIGQTILADGSAATIIGVMPPDFQTFANSNYGPALYMPITDWGSLRQNRGRDNYQTIGRLKDHVTQAQANSELNLIASRLAQQYPDTNKGWGVSIVPLLDDMIDFARPLLFILLGAVGFVLLIACANIANLLLARAASRQREIVVRTALGASRGRIMRQLLCESMLLAAFGGVLGVLLAHGSTKLITSILPSDLPGSANVVVDSRTLIFTCVVVFLTGMGCGLAPAFQAAQVDLNQALKEGGRGNSAGKKGLRLRSLFVVSEVSLALILLTSAGLLVRSFLAYENMDRGYYRGRDLFGTPLALTQKKYNVPQNRINFSDRVLEKLSQLHGINSTAFSSDSAPFGEFAIAGRPVAAPGFGPPARFQIVTPDYFKTQGIPLIHGRVFTNQDAVSTPLVMLIDQGLAKRYFLNENPIGQRLKIALDDTTPAEWREVVGVVGTARFNFEDAVQDRIYIPYRQTPPLDSFLEVRTTPGAFLDLHAISGAVHSVDASVPLTVMFGSGSEDRGTPGVRRLSMLLATLFSGVALLLAAIGIYGVMAYNVAQRTSEIGLRMALGAQQRDVLRLVMTGGARVICFGILFGLLGALASARLLGALLFNVGPYDLLTFGSITLAISVVGFFACLLPALRAIKVSPMVALRSE